MVTRLLRWFTGARGAVRPSVLVSGGVAASAVAVAVAFSVAPSSGTCDRTATTATFATQLSASTAGQTICLAAGSYTFPGKTSASPGVTIRPQDGVAVSFASMTLNASKRADWITFDGSAGASSTMNFGSMELCAPTHNATWTHTTWDNAPIAIRQDGTPGGCGGSGTMIGNTILFDSSVFTNYTPSGGLEGTIHFPGPDAAGAIGVTIQNSLFKNNLGDGIQDGANGVRIINNEFTGMIDCGCGPHTDNIQLYGSSNTLVQGNWVHNGSDGIVSFDCCQTNDRIIGNVIGPAIGQQPLFLYSHSGTVIQHNTVFNGAISYGNKAGQGATGALTVRDNIATAFQKNEGTDATSVTIDHNLCSSACGGTGGITGSPTYSGGTTPSTKAGFALSGLSLGRLGASDGTDMGANP